MAPDARKGVVGATTSIGVLYGGTGATSAAGAEPISPQPHRREQRHHLPSRPHDGALGAPRRDRLGSGAERFASLWQREQWARDDQRGNRGTRPRSPERRPDLDGDEHAFDDRRHARRRQRRHRRDVADGAPPRQRHKPSHGSDRHRGSTPLLQRHERARRDLDAFSHDERQRRDRDTIRKQDLKLL